MSPARTRLLTAAGVAAALAALLIAGWWSARGPALRMDAASRSEARTPAAGADLAPLDPGRAPAERRAQAARTQPSAPATHAVTGEPVERLAVRVASPGGDRAYDVMSVHLVAGTPDGEPEQRGRNRRARWRSGALYEVELPEWAFEGPTLVIARGKNRVPGMAVLSLARGQDRGEVVVRMERGEELTGQVLHRGAPVPDHEVTLDLRRGTPGVFGFGQEGFWLDGRYVEKHATARTDADGRFRFRGLVRERYDLRCSYVEDVTLPRQYADRVRVGAGDLTIDLTLAAFDVRIARADGQPVEQGTLHLKSGRHDLRTAFLGETVRLGVEPGLDVLLCARCPLHAPASVALEGGVRGQSARIDVELHAASPAGLEVVLPGSFALGSRRIEVSAMRRGDFGPCGHLGWTSVALQRTERVDVWRLATLDVPAGRYRFTLERADTFCRESREAEVRHAEDVTIKFTGTPGGLFELNWAPPPAGASVECPWRVEFASGETLASGHSTLIRLPDGAEHIEIEEESSSDFDISSPVPVGVYRLVAEPGGYRSVSRSFEVRLGETTYVDVPLRPR